MTDLERAVAALKGKLLRYTDLWAYYGGDQPVVYTNKRLEEIFRDLDARFVENWCAVVVDSALERLQLTGLTVEDAGAQAALDTVWAANNLGLEADDAHLGALVCGESYLIAWPAPEGGVDIHYNDARMCHLFYDSENPRRKTFAAKWWLDESDGMRRLTLYYPDRLEYYQARQDASGELRASAFEMIQEPATNPYGAVPVFHLRTRRRPTSEIANVVPLQNGINKLLIDMMVAAEFGAFKQRYVISQADVSGQLKNAPNEIWSLPAGDGVSQQTSAGEFTATELSNYFDAIDKLALAVATISRTPKHLLFGAGGVPSGEALIAMEAPLNKKCKAHIGRLSVVWQELASFVLAIGGMGVPAQEISAVFEEPATVQPFTQAQTRQMDVAAGIPLVTCLRREGWTQAELEQLEEDRAAQGQQEANLGNALLAAFDRGTQLGAGQVQPPGGATTRVAPTE